ncbi:MAG: hypothetical protein KBB55_04405, partial [Candidatus Buchananbacteria bacterium]|nr:hypothetical protein [Candidatus Buchananbacteria bacterium]
MKLTIISRKTNWCVTELVRAGKKRGVKVAIVDFNDIDSALKFKGWGDVVIWRSSSLDAAIERSILFRFLKKQGKVIINEGQATNPLVVNKFFQQQIIAQYSGVSGHDSLSGIPSYVFTTSNELSLAIKNKKLTFPFVEKPVLGAHGQGVRKIGAISDIVSTRENVYQNYIPNDGDYRVICLGGRVLGAIKRTATPGDFR